MSSNNAPVIKLPFFFDVDRINQVFESQGIFNRFNGGSTISLMHRQGVSDPWLDGLTSAVLKKEQPLYFSEADFTQMNPGLEDTYFQWFYERLTEQFRGMLGRIRIFKRDPQTSSSLHHDLDVRFHLALKTNPAAFLVFPETGVFHIPADGHVYLVDTTRPHFAVNANTLQSRNHIVCSTYCGIEEQRSNEQALIHTQRKFFLEMSKTYR